MTQDGWATCGAGCPGPLGWTGAALEGAIHQVGQFTSLTARDGVVRISSYDSSHGDLKVLSTNPHGRRDNPVPVQRC
jgi:hypothetical protein